jgi:TM2 domain-containing membrane protein YozV
MTTPEQPGNQPQGYPGYPGQGQPGSGYPAPGGQPAPGYGGQPGSGYPGQPDPGYSDPGYPGPGYTQPDPSGGYPGQPGSAYPPPGPGYPGQPGYSPAPFDASAPFGRHPLTGEPYSDKQKLVAGLLQLFLGGFGAGRWYLGSYGIAVAQLLTCGGLGIWALIDGVLILTGNVRDQYGRPLRD